VEQPNANFGHTIVRQFLYDAFNILQYAQLTTHPDHALQAIAVKTLKEIKYHYRYSSEWMLRLGHGTEVSHGYVQEAVDDLWRYTGEMFSPAAYEEELLRENMAPDLGQIAAEWDQRVGEVFQEAGLNIPEGEVFLQGGKEGRHTEHMGYILTELQYMQRTYPEMKW
jgi:ring-1,2-phenylacetyl-CoA epoxidase subunit PaaC